jgi:hypothetical protein
MTMIELFLKHKNNMMVGWGMHLSPSEIEDLTGYVQRNKQAEHLRKQGIPFMVDRFGNPKVMYATLENLGLTAKKRSKEPNFDALNKRSRNH